MIRPRPVLFETLPETDVEIVGPSGALSELFETIAPYNDDGVEGIIKSEFKDNAGDYLSLVVTCVYPYLLTNIIKEKGCVTI